MGQRSHWYDHRGTASDALAASVEHVLIVDGDVPQILLPESVREQLEQAGWRPPGTRLSDDELSYACERRLRAQHQRIMGDYSGDPTEEHPYQDAGKSWFWEGEAEDWADYIKSLIKAATGEGGKVDGRG